MSNVPAKTTRKGINRVVKTVLSEKFKLDYNCIEFLHKINAYNVVINT